MERYGEKRREDWQIAGTNRKFNYKNGFLRLTPFNHYKTLAWVELNNMCKFVGNDGNSMQISYKPKPGLARSDDGEPKPESGVVVTLFKNGVQFVPEDDEIIKDILKMSELDEDSDRDRG